jgi:hypothetical protein
MRLGLVEVVLRQGYEADVHNGGNLVEIVEGGFRVGNSLVFWNLKIIMYRGVSLACGDELHFWVPTKPRADQSPEDVQISSSPCQLTHPPYPDTRAFHFVLWLYVLPCGPVKAVGDNRDVRVEAAIGLSKEGGGDREAIARSEGAVHVVLVHILALALDGDDMPLIALCIPFDGVTAPIWLDPVVGNVVGGDAKEVIVSLSQDNLADGPQLLRHLHPRGFHSALKNVDVSVGELLEVELDDAGAVRLWLLLKGRDDNIVALFLQIERGEKESVRT